MRLYTIGPVSPRSTPVTGATNASPIVISTLAAHGFTPSDVITIGGITGNTNANGSYDPGSFLLTPSTITLLNKTGNGGFGGSVPIASAPQQLNTAPNFPVVNEYPDSRRIEASKILFTPAPTGTGVLYVGGVGLNQATLRNVMRPINPPPPTGLFDYYELDSSGANLWPLTDYWVDAAKPGTEAVLVSFWLR